MWINFVHVQSKYMAKIYIHEQLKNKYKRLRCVQVQLSIRIFRPI